MSMEERQVQVQIQLQLEGESRERERSARVKMQWTPFFLCLIAVAYADTNYNVAFNKTATQSSDYVDDKKLLYVAGRAVDGDTKNCSHTIDYKGESCSHTKSEEACSNPQSGSHTKGEEASSHPINDHHNKPWWIVDLAGVFLITSINITHRDENGPGKLRCAVIRIGNTTENHGANNTICAMIEESRETETTEHKCKVPITGRYVSVHHDEGVEPLVLCELEAFGKNIDSPLILVKEMKTWEDALDYCREEHLDLASIHNEDMKVWADLVAIEAETPLVWLGLRFTCTLEFWFWVSGECFHFHNWAPGNGTNNEECYMSAAMEKEGNHSWVSRHENTAYYFICEKECK